MCISQLCTMEIHNKHSCPCSKCPFPMDPLSSLKSQAKQFFLHEPERQKLESSSLRFIPPSTGLTAGQRHLHWRPHFPDILIAVVLMRPTFYQPDQTLWKKELRARHVSAGKHANRGYWFHCRHFQSLVNCGAERLCEDHPLCQQGSSRRQCDSVADSWGLDFLWGLAFLIFKG